MFGFFLCIFLRFLSFLLYFLLLYLLLVREVMGYFRAVLQAEEVSERALALTQEVIEINPTFSTAWFYRRHLLTELKKDFSSEEAFMRSIEDFKCYQLWYHRRFVSKYLNNPQAELDFIDFALQDDSKNYHAWSHRFIV